MNREEVVQAAIKVEHWCLDHWVRSGECDCPFRANLDYCVLSSMCPGTANLEYHLRTRGLKNGSV